jgi:hypothetical protein
VVENWFVEAVKAEEAVVATVRLRVLQQTETHRSYCVSGFGLLQAS